MRVPESKRERTEGLDLPSEGLEIFKKHWSVHLDHDVLDGDDVHDDDNDEQQDGAMRPGGDVE